MDIANPMTGSGSFEYIDWGIWAARVVSDALFAGAVSAVVALVLLAAILKWKPDAELPRWQKVLVTAFIAPLLVIAVAYVFRLLTHEDYFTWERLAAIADVYWRVLVGTGAWMLLANALGIDAQAIIDFIKQINNPPLPPPERGRVEYVGGKVPKS
jgi:peptidoglycan biosynthesis protein MviN/MurJ (putative lipid II flippase)